MKFRATLFVLTLSLLLGACEQQDSLDAIQSSGELVVVSRNSPTTYHLGKNGPSGFEFALTGLLAKELGVNLVIEPAFSLQGIFTQLERGEANLAAAGLTLTQQRAAVFPHSQAYYKLIPQVVYVAGTYRPRSLEDLLGMSIVVLASSSHAEALQTLKQQELPDLVWQEINQVDTMELLELVNVGKAQLAIIDSNEFEIQQSLYPRLKVALDLGEEQDMVWYLPPDLDNARLITRINTFIERLQRDGTLDRQRELHFGHTEGISRISSHTFTQQMRKALPPYEPLIKQVANEYQMDWHLLAAVAYQESHWDPKAASPTGVRGMMMLTLPTAREMGVDNRLDAAQSLRGGARYLKNMKRRLPDDIFEPDRTWMALAAYNIGLGHLEDARKLTDAQDGDPHLWREVMDRLPLLQKSKYYKKTRYGFARGLEAVTYVQNIRHYYSILAWQEIPNNKALPPLKMDEYLPDAIKEIGLLSL
ncbi:MAG: membrane-bound lytic murein transglycosylase F [Halioglobus sp.]|jgi:membrane-bound lytic murein transglycosylase F